jgi:transcription termination factor Rho
MRLAEIAHMPYGHLWSLAADLQIEGCDDMHDDELSFAVIRKLGERTKEPIRSEGMLDIIPEKQFGFMRLLEFNYMPGPFDVYVSPPQVRKFKLRTGDIIEGEIRPPKENERYCALLKITAINNEDPEAVEKRDEQTDMTAFDERRDRELILAAL